METLWKPGPRLGRGIRHQRGQSRSGRSGSLSRPQSPGGASGAGPTAPDFLDLFGEILELAGPNPNPHYALVHRDDKVDADFLRLRLNTVAVEFEDRDDLPRWLEALRLRVDAERARPMKWSFSTRCGHTLGNAEKQIELEVVRGSLQEGALPDEYAAISVGTSRGRPFVSPLMRAWLKEH